MLLPTLFCGDLLHVHVVEQSPLPKRQTKPFFRGTKEAPSDAVSNKIEGIDILLTVHSNMLSVR